MQTAINTDCLFRAEGYLQKALDPAEAKTKPHDLMMAMCWATQSGSPQARDAMIRVARGADSAWALEVIRAQRLEIKAAQESGTQRFLCGLVGESSVWGDRAVSATSPKEAVLAYAEALEEELGMVFGENWTQVTVKDVEDKTVTFGISMERVFRSERIEG